MVIEFDAEKSTENQRIRGIGFERFEEIDAAVAIEDTRHDYGERRLRVFGRIGGKLYAAVITLRGEAIRVISLRRANRREERAYAKERQSA